jgi:RecJ-like exonuclease
MSTQTKNKIEKCFWCGGQGYVIKGNKCTFCQGTGELNYVAWVKKRKKYDFNQPIVVQIG